MTLPLASLGRSGLRVPRLGLGGGGPSRLGTRSGCRSFDSSVSVVRRAIDLGIRVFDTAESYGTEPHIAEAVRDLPPSVRQACLICTKHAVRAEAAAPRRTADEFVAAIDRSLRELGVEAIDVEQVHGVTPNDYAHVRREILPALDRARDAGKVRFLGVTEMFQQDVRHETLSRVLDDAATGAPWDAVMVGYNLLNQTAAQSVLPRVGRLGVATIGMFAVRRALSRPERLAELIADLSADSRFDAELVNGSDGRPLSWLLDHADSIAEAAYRFCLSEPGPDVILTGTGSIAHLEANVRAIGCGPLPDGVVARLRRAFGHVTSVTGH